jgi:hypothetical protein
MAEVLGSPPLPGRQAALPGWRGNPARLARRAGAGGYPVARRAQRGLAVVIADLRAGEPFVTAMERLTRAPGPPVVRLVDGLVVAVERGAPLGDVLRAQATDVREQHKRDLVEAGGRREVLMLVPSRIGPDDAADVQNYVSTPRDVQER